MKYITIILSILLLNTVSFAKQTIIKICKEKDYDCQYIPLQDVKKIETINEGEIIRVTFLNGNLLDIAVRNRYYEIKK